MALLGDFFVFGLVNKSWGFWVVFDFKEPDFLCGFVDWSWVSCDLFVNIDNLARNWTVNIGSHFDAFDSHCGVTLVDWLSDGWELHMYDLSELGLCEICDTDSGSLLSINCFNPFVGLGEFDSFHYGR